MTVKTNKPVINTVQEYSRLLPETGFDVELREKGTKVWERIQGIVSSERVEPRDTKTLNSAQTLAVKLDAYIREVGEAELTDNQASLQSPECGKIRSEFYEALRTRIKECDCKVPQEEVLAEMLSHKTRMLPARYPKNSEESIIEHLTKEALENSVPDVAKKCAEELFALSSKQTDSVDQKVGLVSFKEAEEKVLADCRNLMQRISRLTHAPQEAEQESELNFSDNEEERDDLDPEDKIEAKKQKELKKQAAAEAKKGQIHLPEKEKAALDQKFRESLQKCIQEKIGDLRKNRSEKKPLLDRSKAVYEGLMAEGKKLNEEIKQGEKTKEEVTLRIGFLEKSLTDLNTTSPAERNTKQTELKSKKDELKEIQKKLFNYYSRGQQIQTLTDPKTRQSFLEAQAIEKADKAIKIWESIESRLNGDLFPLKKNAVVRSVQSAIQGVIEASAAVEKVTVEADNVVNKKIGEVKSGFWAQVDNGKIRYARLHKWTSEGYKSATGGLETSGNTCKALAEKVLRVNLWFVVAGVGGQLSSYVLGGASSVVKSGIPLLGSAFGDGLEGVSKAVSHIPVTGSALSVGFDLGAITARWVPSVVSPVLGFGMDGLALGSKVVSFIGYTPVNTAISIASIDPMTTAMVATGVATTALLSWGMYKGARKLLDKVFL